MNASIDQAAIGLASATLLGAGIGFERQWRRWMAGVRTNTLVAIGANALWLRLVRLISRQRITRTETDFHYGVRVVCRNPEEAYVRALLLQSTSNGQLSLRRLDSTELMDSDRVEVIADFSAHSKSDALLEQVVRRLSLESTVSAASWSVEPVAE